jgi:hypothetical protein
LPPTALARRMSRIGVTPTMTPQGVEQTASSTACRASSAVIPTMTPQGVEQSRAEQSSPGSLLFRRAGDWRAAGV